MQGLTYCSIANSPKKLPLFATRVVEESKCIAALWPNLFCSSDQQTTPFKYGVLCHIFTTFNFLRFNFLIKEIKSLVSRLTV